MKEWWLFKKQPDADTDVPVAVIIVLYVVAIGASLLIRALTWPEKEQVTAIFFVPSVILPFCLVSVIVYVAFMFHDANIHYFETRKNVAIAAWSAITPLEQPALNMLKLEGEFPLAPKTPVKILLEALFDQTRNEQVFCRLLAPMAEKLKGYNYRVFETIVWVRGGNENCIES